MGSEFILGHQYADLKSRILRIMMLIIIVGLLLAKFFLEKSKLVFMIYKILNYIIRYIFLLYWRIYLSCYANAFLWKVL